MSVQMRPRTLCNPSKICAPIVRTVCQLPVGTLHRQYKAGGRIVVRDNVTQKIDYADPQDDSMR